MTKPTIDGLYQELTSAMLSVVGLHRAIGRRISDDPLEQRAHQEAAARMERQIERFARLAQETHA